MSDEDSSLASIIGEDMGILDDLPDPSPATAPVETPVDGLAVWMEHLMAFYAPSDRRGDKSRLGPSVARITKRWSTHPTASVFLPLKDGSGLIYVFDMSPLQSLPPGWRLHQCRHGSRRRHRPCLDFGGQPD